MSQNGQSHQVINFTISTDLTGWLIKLTLKVYLRNMDAHKYSQN